MAENFKRAGLLFVPNPDLEKEVEADKITSEKIFRRYEEESDVREIADKIHESRMGPGPTCEQCIAAAIYRKDHKEAA